VVIICQAQSLKSNEIFHISHKENSEIRTKKLTKADGEQTVITSCRESTKCLIVASSIYTEAGLNSSSDQSGGEVWRNRMNEVRALLFDIYSECIYTVCMAQYSVAIGVAEERRTYFIMIRRFHTVDGHNCHDMYRLQSGPKMAFFVCLITSPHIDQFSNFFT